MESLNRFLDAQESSYSGYQVALAEMKSGGKQSHWIWYIFPQIEGLGRSSTATYYAIQDLEEAKAFLNHPVLRARLREITQVILSYPADTDPNQFMMAPIDAMKLKSSMTMFDAISPNDIFGLVIEKFFEGFVDNRTLNLIGL